MHNVRNSKMLLHVCSPSDRVDQLRIHRPSIHRRRRHHDLTQPLLPDGIVAGAAINVGNVLLLFCGGQFRDPPGSTTFSVTERYF